MGEPVRKLGHYIEVKHGFAFKGKYFVDVPTNNVLVTPGNFAMGGGFQKEKVKYYDGPVPEEYVLQPADLIITMTDLSKKGDTLGYPAIVPYSSSVRYLHNQRIGLVKIKNQEEADSRFLYYRLCADDYRHYILATASGSTVRHTSPGRICDFEADLPPLPVQKRIAHILGTLDDKIELNRRMNETLEAIARAIFKSWFVDFDPVIDNALRAGNPIPPEFAERAEKRRQILNGASPASPTNSSPAGRGRGEGENDIHGLFPSEFVDSELGPIPKGWEVSPLSEIIEIIGGGTPKTSVAEYWNGDIPWFSVVDAPADSDVFVIDTEKHVSEAGVENSSTKVLREGTTIISARGTVGRCALAGRPMTMNQSCYGIVGAAGFGDYFTYFTIRAQVSDLQTRGHGSVFNTITRDTFASIVIAKTDCNSTTEFDQLVQALMLRLKANLLESKTLVALRNNLLPRLLSGKLLSMRTKESRR